jgi:hypothetical protein
VWLIFDRQRFIVVRWQKEKSSRAAIFTARGAEPNNQKSQYKELKSMSLYLSMPEIRRATSLGILAVRKIIRHPYPLVITLAAAAKQGGAETRLFLVADILPRLRQLPKITEEQITELLSIAQARYKTKEYSSE